MAFSAISYNFQQPHAVSHRFPPCNWLSSRPVLVFNKENRYPVVCLAGRSKGGFNPRILSVVRAELYKWADKQSVLVGAVSCSVYFFMQGFIWGFLIKKLHEYITTPHEISEMQLSCAQTGDYSPLFSSMAGSPLMFGRNFAVFYASDEFISYVIARLIGKKSYILSKMAGSFGAGIIISLVTGMRAPISVISIGVICALVSAMGVKLSGVPASWK